MLYHLLICYIARLLLLISLKGYLKVAVSKIDIRGKQLKGVMVFQHKIEGDRGAKSVKYFKCIQVFVEHRDKNWFSY